MPTEPVKQGRKLPIDRPCSACSAGDTEMEHHDHQPPFRAASPAESQPAGEFAGFKIMTDPSVPPGEIHIRNVAVPTQPAGGGSDDDSSTLMARLIREAAPAAQPAGETPTTREKFERWAANYGWSIYQIKSKVSGVEAQWDSYQAGLVAATAPVPPQAGDADAIEQAAKHLWEYGCSAGMSKMNDELMLGHFRDTIRTAMEEWERKLREVAIKAKAYCTICDDWRGDNSAGAESMRRKAFMELHEAVTAERLLIGKE